MTSEQPSSQPPLTAMSVNDVADGLIDGAQSVKNFINELVNRGVDLGQDFKDEVNNALDAVIDKAQEIKG